MPKASSRNDTSSDSRISQLTSNEQRFYETDYEFNRTYPTRGMAFIATSPHFTTQQMQNTPIIMDEHGCIILIVKSE